MKYYVMTDTSGAHASESKCWSMMENWRFPLGEDLRNRQSPVHDWPEDAQVDCDPDGPFNDMGWGGGDAFIVSDRLRRLLERETPESWAFYPVETWKNGEPINYGLGPYWAAHILVILPTLDRKLSDYQEYETYFSIRHLVIDTSLIAAECKVFRSRESIDVLVRTDLMNTIKRAGFTGVWFEPVDQS